tara:strand:- start:3038 stop:5116 length:2079 start_codon:yes stop_codon:yes gene_type:complete
MAFGQYVNLDFDEIKQSIRDYLRANTNFTDYDFEGSNLSIIIDALAYNTYITAYNTNMATNECFLDSSTLRENVVALARNIGYVPRSRRAARAKISFQVDDLTETVSLTINAGIICNGAGRNSNFIFSIPEDITVPVVNGVGVFNNIEIFEGNFISQNFTVDESLTNQRFILDNSFIDTSTIKVKVKPSEASTSRVTYTQIDNIVGVTSTSSSYLLQEIEDERYELIFGDNVIAKKLSNNNFIEVSYITTDGRDGNGAAEFSFVGNITNQDGAEIDAGNISLVTTEEKSRDGDNIESISSIKYYAPRIYSSQYRAVTSSDYESVLGFIYPNVESVTAYGGEEMSPPRFGKVFISVKPRNGDFLSDQTKRELIQKLKSYAVAGIVPEFIDLKYLYVELKVNAYYNPNLNDDQENLKTSISNALDQYSKSIDVNKFGGRFKYSKAISLIDAVDSSITSNITLVCMRRNLKSEIGRLAQYELCFGNRMYQAEPAYNIISTGFTIEGVSNVVYLADEKIDNNKGRIFFFTYVEGGQPTIVKKNAGTVDYLHGEVLIDTVNILSTVIENNVIEVQAVPHSNDVIGLRDLYVKFDMTNTTLTMVPDIIASGENTSGSRFIHTHSYYMPKFTRDSESAVSTTGLVTSVNNRTTGTASVTSSSTSAARAAASSSPTTSVSSSTTAMGGGSSSTPSSGSGY